jgi:hypothetical protein
MIAKLPLLNKANSFGFALKKCLVQAYAYQIAKFYRKATAGIKGALPLFYVQPYIYILEEPF